LRDQPQIWAGDLLIYNFGGIRPLKDTQHAEIAVSDARSGGAMMETKVVGASFKGARRATLCYPRDATKLLTQHSSAGLFCEQSVFLVRYTDRPGFPTRRDLLPYVLKAADAFAHVKYNIQLHKVLSSQSCFQAGRQAQKYAAAAREEHKIKSMQCSELAVACWVAGIYNYARRHNESGARLLAQLLPVDDPSRCWPRHLMAIPAKVPDHWQLVGIVTDVFSTSDQRFRSKIG
jgi:hypothetical protein